MRHSGSPLRSLCGTSSPRRRRPPFLATTASAADESTMMDVGTPTDDINCSIPGASPLALTAARSSASALLVVTFFCVLLQLFKWCVPLIMTPPLVDLAVRMQPAQLLSDNTSISPHISVELVFRHHPAPRFLHVSPSSAPPCLCTPTPSRTAGPCGPRPNNWLVPRALESASLTFGPRRGRSHSSPSSSRPRLAP